MTALLKAFIEIALWRRGPGHLPDSTALAILAAAAYAACSAVQSWMLFGMQDLVGRTLADVLLAGALIWLLLLATGRRHRFRQTASAVFGTGALLSPLVIALLVLKTPAAASQPLALFVWAGSVAVIVWFTLIVGHILRAALDTGLFTAMAVSVAYLVGSAALITWWFPSGA